MTQELKLRRKWTFRAHGKQVVFIKKTFESEIHVLTKAFLWALFLPDYPDLSVEIQVGNRFKPDLVQISDHQQNWGYEDGPWKGPGPPLLGAADLYQFISRRHRSDTYPSGMPSR